MWKPEEDSLTACLFPTFNAIKTLASQTLPHKPKQCLAADNSRNCYRVCRLVSGRFPSYDLLHKWKLVLSPICPWCNTEQDSISHLVLYCSFHGEARDNLINSIDFYPLSIADLLTERKLVVALEQFLNEVQDKQDLLSNENNETST